MFGFAVDGAQKAALLITAPLRMISAAIIEPTA